ncbi:MAG: BON domain-containing protein [Acidobacteriota bacterium]|nr:BON domain-containing protein [Acidobacteriota bacterium]
MTKILNFAAVALLAVSSLAADSKPAAHSAAANHPKLSDPEIERNIRTKLAKSKIGKDGFTPHVKGGVVTWEGSTNVIQHKGAATRMARTSGASQVVNNIKISDAARAKAAGNLSGGARRVQVKTATP